MHSPVVIDEVTQYFRDRVYKLDRKYYRKGSRLLHREVWEANFGPIPEGYHIHHIDRDRGNNNPSNLACLTPEQHGFEHRGEKRPHQPLPVAAWEGHARWRQQPGTWEFYSQHAKKVWENLEPLEHTCTVCGKKYETKHRGKNLFCGNNCQAEARRRSGIDDEDRVCLVCGETFRCNKYARKKVCGRVCSGIFRRGPRKRVQPEG